MSFYILNACFTAEQKLRDKLAAAARDKMSQVTQHTKEKELQAERKKRAAMFINMLKSKNKSSSAPIGNIRLRVSP